MLKHIRQRQDGFLSLSHHRVIDDLS